MDDGVEQETERIAHLGKQRLQGRAVERGSRQAAIIIVRGHKPPALAGLAADIGLTGFPLGIERGEGEVEIMLGRFAGVDGAAQGLCGQIGHGSLPRETIAVPAGYRGEVDVAFRREGQHGGGRARADCRLGPV